MSKNLDNPNAMTSSFALGLDYDRGFYLCDTAGSIDAPAFAPAGSTIENVIETCGDLNGRYVMANIIFRG